MRRGGCIIRSAFPGKIKEAFDKNANLSNLLLDPFFKDKIPGCQNAWRRVIATALTNGIPVPAFTTALCYFDGFRNARLPANFLQAQLLSRCMKSSTRIYKSTQERNGRRMSFLYLNQFFLVDKSIVECYYYNGKNYGRSR